MLATNTALLTQFQAINIAPMEFFRTTIIAEESGAEEVEIDGWCLYPPGFDASRERAERYPVSINRRTR